MKLAQLPDLTRWQSGELVLAETLLVAGAEGLWVPLEPSPEAMARALRCFVGGLPTRLRQIAGTALRGIPIEGFEPRWIPPAAEIERHLASNRQTFVSFRWQRAPMRVIVTGEASGGSFSGRLSPVRLVDETTVAVGKGALAVVTAESACPEPTLEAPGSPVLRPVLLSRTIGIDRGATRRRAISEALERYALATLPSGGLKRATANELEAPYLDPGTVVPYSRLQRDRHGLRQFSPDDPEWWVRGHAVAGDREATWVPASLALAPFPAVPVWGLRGHQNTNGAAYHDDLNRAIEHAWLELVERDAFMRTWRLGTSVKTVAQVAWPPVVGEILERIRAGAPSSRTTVGRLESQGVPVWIVVASGPIIGVCIGCAAGSLWDALPKAAMESLAQVMFPAAPVKDRLDVVAAPDHAGFYRHASRFRSADHLHQTVSCAIDIDGAAAAGVSPRGYVVHLEVPHGFPGFAVRAIDPDLIPLAFGFDAEPLAHPALDGRPLVGVEPTLDVAEPHPFS